MESTDIIESIEAIKVDTPVDKIIRQLKLLISSGQLKPGDRLPAERVLAEKFGVGRSYIREAILRLEFYGLLKTSPQSGTYVASGYSIKVLDSILNDIIKFNKDDFGALIEARYFIELNSVKLAAERRTEEDIKALQTALEDYSAKINKGLKAVEEDMLFHIKIAKATRNSVFESMILILSPDIIKYKVESNVCKTDVERRAIKEHEDILGAIIDKDVAAAEKAMAAHLEEILRISREGNWDRTLL